MYKTFVSTLHCALENGTYLCVNERWKIRHYRARSTEERRRKPNPDVYFAQCLHKIALYSDIIHSLDWKSAIEHDGGI